MSLASFVTSNESNSICQATLGMKLVDLAAFISQVMYTRMVIEDDIMVGLMSEKMVNMMMLVLWRYVNIW